MRNERMTEEELDKLLESGHVELEFDDDEYTACYRKVTVLKKSTRGDKYIAEDSDGDSMSLRLAWLKRYPSQAKPNTVELFERTLKNGTIGFFAKGGAHPDFEIKKLVCDGLEQGSQEIPNGRTLKLNLETWEYEA